VATSRPKNLIKGLLYSSFSLPCFSFFSLIFFFLSSKFLALHSHKCVLTLSVYPLTHTSIHTQ